MTDIDARIVADLEESRRQFENLPEDEKRKITDETAQRLGFGVIEKWTSPKAPGTLPTTRFIVRLGDDNNPPAYNAILTPAERRRVKHAPKLWEYGKCLSSGSKFVFNPSALKEKFFIVFEGEFDAASVLQATNWQIPACALGGTGATGDILKRLSAMTDKPEVFICFDDEEEARQRAVEFLEKLHAIKVPAIALYLDDFISDEDKGFFGDKIDANEILQRKGDKYLSDVMFRLVTENIELLDDMADKFKNNPTADKPVEKPVFKYDRSSDIELVVNEINEKTPDDLISAGLLEKARKGKFVCPWCGSGTRTGSGALNYSTRGNNPHFVCHVCGKGGDVLTLFAQVENMSNRGEGFFELVRAAADKLHVSYDPKIFDLKPVQVETTDPAVTAWQKVNGLIDPMIYLEIRGAENELLAVDDTKITAEYARSSATIHKLALCTFYDFASKAVDKFFDAFESARNTAKSIVNGAKDSGATVAVEIKTLAKLPDRELRAEVKHQVVQIRKAHKQRQAHLNSIAKAADKKAREEKRLKNDQQALGNNYLLTEAEQAEYLLSQEDDDTGRANQFVYLFGDRVRFIGSREQWVFFDYFKDAKGNRTNAGVWKLGNPGKNTIVMPLAGEVHKFLVANATPNNTTPDFDKQVKAWRNLKCMSNAVRTAGTTKLNIQISPDDLDRNKNLLLCRNGVIDLQTKKFYPDVDKLAYITKCCNAIYDPQAAEEFVHKFLTDIMPNEDTLRAMFRWLGYSATGEMSQRIVHFWKGEGANAKSTLLAVIVHLLGSYATNIPSELICDNNAPTNANNATPALAALMGVRLAVSSELKQGSILNAKMVKDLSSGEQMPVRLLHCNAENFEPTSKLIICGNFYPKLTNVTDKGLLRRIQTIEFTQTFEGDKADPTMPEKLMQTFNLSAMLNLIVNGAYEFYREGKLLTSEEMTASRQAYIDKNDFIAQFVEEYCVLGDNVIGMRKEILDKIQAEYFVECKRLGIKEVEKQIEAKFVKSKRKTKNGRQYLGIGLVGDPPEGTDQSDSQSNNLNGAPVDLENPPF